MIPFGLGGSSVFGNTREGLVRDKRQGHGAGEDSPHATATPARGARMPDPDSDEKQ